jgi:branched-chain amino acid transport system substrate-binding protein
MKLWEAAVQAAGTLRQDAVIAALDRASISEGPGGGAEMVPGQHHVRMNMYIARVTDGSLRIVKNLGAIDPNERSLPVAQFKQAPAI